MSPTDDFATYDIKCREFTANDIKVVLLLMARKQSVAIYRPRAEPVSAEDIRAVVVGPEMPGFILDAEAVFAASVRKRPTV